MQYTLHTTFKTSRETPTYSHSFVVLLRLEAGVFSFVYRTVISPYYLFYFSSRNPSLFLIIIPLSLLEEVRVDAAVCLI
jgi:hypothetical protein